MSRLAIVVLGMHRSGTSAFARIVSLLGAQLPRHLLEAGPENQRGFWESPLVAMANERLLNALGSSWDSYLTLPELPAERSASWVGEFTRILDQEYGESEVIVLKDPRICRLLPVWRQALEERGYALQCVVPVRNPLEVARSLRARNGIGLAHGTMLWGRYVLDSILLSSTVPRLPLPYETLLEDPAGVARQLQERLGLRTDGSLDAASPEIGEFVDAALRHQRSTWESFFEEAAIPALVKEVGRAARSWCEAPDVAIDARAAELAASWAAAESVFGAVLNERAAEMAEFRTEIARRDLYLSATNARLASVERDKARLESYKREAERLEGVRLELRNYNELLKRDRESYKREAERLEGVRLELRNYLRQSEAARIHLEGELALIRNSLSWRATRPLRGAAQLGRYAVNVARHAAFRKRGERGQVVLQEPASSVQKAEDSGHGAATASLPVQAPPDEALTRARALFDEAWFRRRYPTVAAEWGEALLDRYLGADVFAEDLQPNPFVQPSLLASAESAARTGADLFELLGKPGGGAVAAVNRVLDAGWRPAAWYGSTGSDGPVPALLERLPGAEQRLRLQSPRAQLVPDAVCDVVIPVFNSPDNVRTCVRTLLSWTPRDLLGRVVLADDGSAPRTQTVLAELAEDSRVDVLRRDHNVGYLRNVNDAIGSTTAEFVLLLNSDCYVGPNTVRHLLAAMRNDERVGLVSPLSNNAPPLSLPMLPGFSHVAMDELLASEGPGARYSACTIVGNCLMIRRRCWDDVGSFDESWGAGYGEESDYQFRSAARGWRSYVAADTYVYHQGHASFGESEAAKELRSKNWHLFMERWGQAYRDELENRYVDPVADWEAALLARPEVPPLHVDALFVLPAVKQAIGGTMVVVELAEKLLARGMSAAVAVPAGSAVLLEEQFPLTILTLPETDEDISGRVRARYVFATHWKTVELVQRITNAGSGRPIYFIQGFEPIFSAGRDFELAVQTYRRIPDAIAISQWLVDKVDSLAGCTPRRIVFGPNPDLFYPKPDGSEGWVPTVGMVLRGMVDKGDHVLRQLLHRLCTEHVKDCRVVVLDGIGSADLMSAPNLDMIRGPLSRRALADLMRRVDIWVDASLHEGYGRLPVEAMACGAALVTSDAGGNREYAGGPGTRVVPAAADGDAYLEAVKDWLVEPTRLAAAKEAALVAARAQTFDDGVDELVAYLRELG